VIANFSKRARRGAVLVMDKTSQPPKWIKPQLTRVVDEAPAGDDWLHEIKYDGYCMHARLDHGKVQLLTRAGLDWSTPPRQLSQYLGDLARLGAIRLAHPKERG